MHRGLYHGDLEGPGELERAVGLVARPADTVSRGRSELVLVHADHRRLRLLVNLVAQLGKLGEDKGALFKEVGSLEAQLAQAHADREEARNWASTYRDMLLKVA